MVCKKEKTGTRLLASRVVTRCPCPGPPTVPHRARKVAPDCLGVSRWLVPMEPGTRGRGVGGGAGGGGGGGAEEERGGGRESAHGEVVAREGHRVRAGHQPESGTFPQAPAEGGAGEGEEWARGGTFSLSSSSSSGG